MPKLRTSRQALVGSLLVLVAVTAATGRDIVGLTFVGDVVWIDTDTGDTTKVVRLPSAMQALARSPSGELYAADGRNVFLVDLAEAEYTRVVTVDLPHEGPVSYTIRGMAFAPSGELYVAIGWAEVVRPSRLGVVDISTGGYSDFGEFQGASTSVQGLAFAPDGRLFGIAPHKHATSDYCFMEIDPAEATVKVVGMHRSPAGCQFDQGLAFTEEGRLFAAGYRAVSELDPQTGAPHGALLECPGLAFHGIEVVSKNTPPPAKHPQPGIDAISGTQRLPKTREPRSRAAHDIDDNANSENRARCGNSANITIGAITYGGDYLHVDAETGAVVTKNCIPGGIVQALACMSSGQLLAINKRGLYELDSTTGANRFLTPVHMPSRDEQPYAVRGMVMSPEGKLIVSIGWTGPSLPDRLGVLDVETGEYKDIDQFTGDHSRVQGLAFSPAGRLYGIDGKGRPDHDFYLMEINSHNADVKVLGLNPPGHDAQLDRTLAFAHDGRLFAAGYRGLAEINPINGAPIGTVHTIHGPPITGMVVLSNALVAPGANTSNGQRDKLRGVRAGEDEHEVEQCPACNRAMTLISTSIRERRANRDALPGADSPCVQRTTRYRYTCTCGTRVTITRKAAIEVPRNASGN